jgi:hypothetical protein
LTQRLYTSRTPAPGMGWMEASLCSIMTPMCGPVGTLLHSPSMRGRLRSLCPQGGGCFPRLRALCRGALLSLTTTLRERCRAPRSIKTMAGSLRCYQTWQSARPTIARIPPNTSPIQTARAPPSLPQASPLSQASQTQPCRVSGTSTFTPSLGPHTPPLPSWPRRRAPPTSTLQVPASCTRARTITA